MGSEGDRSSDRLALQSGDHRKVAVAWQYGSEWPFPAGRGRGEDIYPAELPSSSPHIALIARSEDRINDLPPLRVLESSQLLVDSQIGIIASAMLLRSVLENSEKIQSSIDCSTLPLASSCVCRCPNRRSPHGFPGGIMDLQEFRHASRRASGAACRVGQYCHQAIDLPVRLRMPKLVFPWPRASRHLHSSAALPRRGE